MSGPDSSNECRPGDKVEVAGFLTTEHMLAGLRSALVRPLGTAALPAPAEVSAERMLHPRLRSEWTGEAFEDYSDRLIRLRGRVLRVERGADGEPLKLQLDSEGNGFSAWLPLAGKRQVPGGWIEGAELELPGTAEMDFMEQPGSLSSIAASGFRVWLSSPENVRVLGTPPWRTPHRLWLALGGAALVCAQHGPNPKGVQVPCL